MRLFPSQVTRRQALAAGVAGAAAHGAAHLQKAAAGDEGTQRAHARMPVVFLPHGGGPWPFVEMGLDRGEVASLAAYLRSIEAVARQRPRALLVVPAHWEEAVATVMTAASPPMLYDYSGFPPESYMLTWPAPGAPKVAARATWLRPRHVRAPQGCVLAHPREEHLLPLSVAAGAAGADRGSLAFQGRMMGAQLSAFHFG